MTGQAVEVHGLRRTFERRGHPERVALAGVDLVVAAGEVHGLLGPNGAGKTTLCKILSTVLLPTAGSVRVAGHDAVSETAAVRRSIGIVLGGERGLYTRLSARQNLMFWSALYRRPTREARHRSAELLARVGLADRADERVETFSRGMKQRLHLARGLIGDPSVLILDEPTIGMDPVAARDFRRLIAELRHERRTILMTTHDMAEAESVCDRVTMIDDGRVLTTEETRTIGRWLSTYERVTAHPVGAGLADALRAIPGVASVRHRPDSATATVETIAPGAAHAVLRVLVDAGIADVSTSRPGLSEVYLHLIGDRGLEVR